MKYKKFTRFVVNTNKHPHGEKIKAINMITKIYDDDNNYIDIKKPYITALADQVEIDLEDVDYKDYMPMHHWREVSGVLTKKTQVEIDTLEQQIADDRAQKQVILNQSKTDKDAAKTDMLDTGKTDAERLDAVIRLLSNTKL